MADHAGFLDAINRTPEDDTPRLIYADWLEENGEPERAEFIRVQCQAASLPESDERDTLEDHADDLLRLHERRWLRELPGTKCAEFHRGFLERIEMTPRQFTRLAEPLFNIGPACTVGLLLQRSRSRLDKRLESPFGKRLAGLHLIDGPVSTLEQVEDLPNLRRLELTRRDSNRREDAAARAALKRMLGYSWVGQLRVLRIGGWPFTDEEAGQLAEAARPGRLRGLVLRDSSLSYQGVLHLAQSEAVSRLEALGIDSVQMTERDLAALAASPNLGALRALCLEEVHEAGQVKALAPLIRRLSWLSLNSGFSGDDALGGLTALDEPRSLRTLVLRQCRNTTAEGLHAFALSPLAQRLRVLDMGASDLTGSHLRGLLDGRGLSRLRGFSVAGNSPLKDAAAEVLEDWPGFPRLRWLDLAGASTSGARLCRLLESADRPHLVVLRHDDRTLYGRHLVQLLTGKNSARLVELALDAELCSEREVRALKKLPALPRLSALALNSVDSELLKELEASPFCANLRRPIRRGDGDARVGWVKRNCALDHLGPADEEY